MTVEKLTITKTTAEQIMLSIEELMEMRAILRKYAPEFKIIEAQDERSMIKMIKRVGKWLLPLFEQQGLCGEPQGIHVSSDVASGQSLDSGIALLEHVADSILFIGSNAVKKKLKGLGIEPNIIITAGGPINIDDLKKINPNIPAAALEGYQKKIDAVITELTKAAKTGKPIVFVMAPDEETDKLLESRLPELEKKLEIKFKRLFVKSWDKI